MEKCRTKKQKPARSNAGTTRLPSLKNDVVLHFRDRIRDFSRKPFAEISSGMKHSRRNTFYRGENGAPRRIRTPDLLIRSQTLYPAELGARMRACVVSAARRVDRRYDRGWQATIYKLMTKFRDGLFSGPSRPNRPADAVPFSLRVCPACHSPGMLRSGFRKTALVQWDSRRPLTRMRVVAASRVA